MRHHIGIFLKVAGYCIGFFLAATVAYLILAGILSLFGFKELPEITGEFITDLAALPLVILIFKLYSAHSRKELFEKSLQLKKLLLLIPISLAARLLLLIGILIIFSFIMLILRQDISSVIDEGLEYQWNAFEQSVGIVQIFGYISFVILGPLNEELFNRGVILNFLKKHYSVRVSVIYSSIIFMLLHFHPGLYLSSLLLGVVLAVVYIRWKNIWYPILLHMLINLHPFIIDLFLARP